MKWTLIGALTVAAVCTYAATPFYALSQLRAAIESRDASQIAKRVDILRFGSSVANQLVFEALKQNEQLRREQPFISGIGATAAGALMPDLLSHAGLLDMISCKKPPMESVRVLPCNLLGEVGPNARSVLLAFTNSEYGIGTFDISVPFDTPRGGQYRLRLQLLRWTWKLTGVELPEHVRVALARDLERRIGH